MGANKWIFRGSVVFQLIIMVFTAIAARAEQENKKHRYEIKADNISGQNIFKIKANTFIFQRETSAVVRFNRADDDRPVHCRNMVSFYFGDEAIKINPDGAEEIIYRFVSATDSLYSIRFVDYEALFVDGKRGIFEGSLFLAPQNCPEKRK